MGDGGIDKAVRFAPVRETKNERPAIKIPPLLQKEKHLETVVRKILPRQIADCVCQARSRLAYLYGHPETHKEKLSLRPILSVHMNVVPRSTMNTNGETES